MNNTLGVPNITHSDENTHTQVPVGTGSVEPDNVLGQIMHQSLTQNWDPIQLERVLNAATRYKAGQPTSNTK